MSNFHSVGPRLGWTTAVKGIIGSGVGRRILVVPTGLDWLTLGLEGRRRNEEER